MSTSYVGEIRLFSFPRIPTDWLACDGALYSIAQYQILFTLIGTTYGGNGVTTFAVPDLRGQLPVHQGKGNNLSPYVIGQTGGFEGVTLLSTQIPSHSHSVVVNTTAGTSNAPSATVQLGALSSDTMYATDVTGVPPTMLNPLAVGPNTGNQAHSNLMPTLTASFCISAFGIFPSQS